MANSFNYFYKRRQRAYKFTLRISLKNSPVPVWRKFIVPSNISLRGLGDLILELFGWDNYHLNAFYSSGVSFWPADNITDEAYFWDRPEEQEKYSIQDILCVKGKKVKFEYDFGDSWLHEITLSSIEEYKRNEKHEVIFLKGKGACPPEDCGGVYGYAELIDALEKLKRGEELTEEEKGYLEWAGWDETYDVNYLDEEDCKIICSQY